MATRKSSSPTPMRRCIGSTRFGIQAHDAPESEFPRQPSQKDGLGRMCKPHWQQYTAGLARDARARKATQTSEPKPEPDPEPTIKRRRGKVRDATADQSAEHAELERQLAEAGGPGTDAGQAILEQAADRSASLRVGHRGSKASEPIEEEAEAA